MRNKQILRLYPTRHFAAECLKNLGKSIQKSLKDAFDTEFVHYDKNSVDFKKIEIF